MLVIKTNYKVNKWLKKSSPPDKYIDAGAPMQATDFVSTGSSSWVVPIVPG